VRQRAIQHIVRVIDEEEGTIIVAFGELDEPPDGLLELQVRVYGLWFGQLDEPPDASIRV
jgi:hypothetical protein